MHKVAHDRTFLTETLKNTIQVDDFTRKLFEIYETVQNEGVSQVKETFSNNRGVLVMAIFLYRKYDNING